MTTYYVGSGGDNANAGTSWALRKLTLNGAEDIPVAAGDTVYVGPGTYRELLTCDVSGSSGSPIAYIGDYDGSHTDGVGGVVRITGSDDDQTATRNSCIVINSKNYRTFRGFSLGHTANNIVNCGSGTNGIIESCCFGDMAVGMACVGDISNTGWAVRNCFAVMSRISYGVKINVGSATDTAAVIENCIFIGGYGVYANKGTLTARNCLFFAIMLDAIIALNLVGSGLTVTVNNCIICNSYRAFVGAATGDITENYNCLYGNNTNRTNTDTGANSLNYAPLLDMRWFFELVGGGSMVTPFDLASYSQLINVAGTSPTTADMRGTTVQGAQREWGALEYDSTLDIEAGSGGGRPAFGDRSGGKF